VIYNYIAIEGNIGAGKTSLAQKMAEDYNAGLILEQFEDNPFLPKFYNNPEKYSFPLELSFLASRYQQIKEEFPGRDRDPKLRIADYYLGKSLIFARVNLQKEEFKLFRQLYDIIIKQLIRPDILVYLHVETEKLMQQIRLRGREYEQSIEEEYLLGIQEAYYSFFKSLTTTRILIVDITEIDFVESPEDYRNLKAAIMSDEYSEGITRLVL